MKTNTQVLNYLLELDSVLSELTQSGVIHEDEATARLEAACEKRGIGFWTYRDWANENG